MPNCPVVFVHNQGFKPCCSLNLPHPVIRILSVIWIAKLTLDSPSLSFLRRCSFQQPATEEAIIVALTLILLNQGLMDHRRLRPGESYTSLVPACLALSLLFEESLAYFTPNLCVLSADRSFAISIEIQLELLGSERGTS